MGRKKEPKKWINWGKGSPLKRMNRAVRFKRKNKNFFNFVMRDELMSVLTETNELLKRLVYLLDYQKNENL